MYDFVNFSFPEKKMRTSQWKIESRHVVTFAARTWLDPEDRDSILPPKRR